VPQCSMVLEQSNQLLSSHHLHNHCSCVHGLWVYRDPVTAKQFHALPLNNHMSMQPCCWIIGIRLHKAAWWLNSQTTYFHHTTSITTVHVNMAFGCTGSKPAPCIATNQPYVNPTMLFDPCYHVTQCSMEPSNHLLPSHHLYSHCACAHGLSVYWDPVAAKQLLAFQLTSNM
jgi:hypothetical protein